MRVLVFSGVGVLVFSGVALIAAGGILLRIALRSSQRYYRWFTPRPATPPGLDPLPDEWLAQWQDPKAAEAEIAQIERDGRDAKVLASRYSRVLPAESAAPLALDPAATTERDEPSAADPDLNLDVETVATANPPGTELTDAWNAFFRATLRALREYRGRAPTPPADR